jgi:hypothetical protein
MATQGRQGSRQEGAPPVKLKRKRHSFPAWVACPKCGHIISGWNSMQNYGGGCVVCGNSTDRETHLDMTAFVGTQRSYDYRLCVGFGMVGVFK